jgi:hypothetical protein
MKHCIIDFETMGLNTNNCVVIDISAMVFDWDKFSSDKPYTLDDIAQVRKFKFDIKEQVSKYGFVIEESTIKFWESQPKEVRKNITPQKSDITLEEFVEEFINFLIPHGKIHRWWCRGNSFDAPILWRIFDTLSKKNRILEYLPHWALRDSRTWIDAKLDFPKKNGFVPIEYAEQWETSFKAHDSSWDILADVLRFQTIDRAEKL